jgi:phosphoglycolate phosphatase-like HAD superfamily hydrolase
MNDTTDVALVRMVVFDFDGTLCDSVDVKTEAFYQLYLDEHGEAFARGVEDYHLAHQGLPRYDKIEYVETEMLGTPPSDERVQEVAERFSQLVEDGIVAAPLFDGVLAFLEEHHGHIPLMIASATPTEELRRIADRKDITGYFAGIEGSPRSKSAIIEDFSGRLSLPPEAIIMVGDQPSDATAAREVGTRGVMITEPAEWTAPFERFETFKEAAVFLSSKFA